MTLVHFISYSFFVVLLGAGVALWVVTALVWWAGCREQICRRRGANSLHENVVAAASGKFLKPTEEPVQPRA